MRRVSGVQTFLFVQTAYSALPGVFTDACKQLTKVMMWNARVQLFRFAITICRIETIGKK